MEYRLAGFVYPCLHIFGQSFKRLANVDLSSPVSFNITLHAAQDFSYCDQGILTLQQQLGQWAMRLDLAAQGSSQCLLNLTRYPSGRAFGFSSLETGELLNQPPLELLVCPMGSTLCISGQGLIKEGSALGKACFIAGFAMHLYE